MIHPILPVALPLLAAFLLPILHRVHPVLSRATAPAVVALSVILGLELWLQVLEHGPMEVAMGGFPAPLGITFRADHLNLVFVLAVGVSALLLWPKGQRDELRENALMLLLVGAGSGIALSTDLFNLFVLYELVAVASYGLAASRGTGASFAATLRYLVLSGLGSAFALLGIALIYGATGTLNLAHLAEVGPTVLAGPLGLTAFLLMTIGFGVKAELFPMNTWVPEVYATTTVRAAGLLAGAISKLGLLILLKLLLTAYAGTSAGLILLVAGLASVFTGELAALRATDLRRILAYSSIGQLGLVAIAFSLPGGVGILAGVAVALNHLVVKPAMFLIAERWGNRLSDLTGAAHGAPVSTALFFFLGLSLIGVPPLPGFWAKFLLLSALLEAGHGLAVITAVVLLLAAVVEAAYLFRIARTLYEPAPVLRPVPARGDLVPAGVLGLALLLAVVFVAPLGDALARIIG